MTLEKLAERKKERIDNLADASASSGGTSLMVDALRRLVRNPVAITGAAIIGSFLLLAAFAPLLAPHDPATRFDELINASRADHIPGPIGDYPLGADNLGRDFASRLIYASRQTLFVGVFATLIGLAIGMVIGGLAGALGGWVDTLLMR
ncbi:MAG: ABC transporter permease, partial [Micromonosporaceae bacterium]